MGNLSKRVAYLEHQLEQLAEQQRRLQNLQTLLRMSESFKALHRLLFREASSLGSLESRRMRRALSRHRLEEDDLIRTMDICRLRNEAAHPREIPDLTEVDPDLARVYEKVQRFLAEVGALNKK